MFAEEHPELGDPGLAVERRPLMADRLAIPGDGRLEVAMRIRVPPGLLLEYPLRISGRVRLL